MRSPVRLPSISSCLPYLSPGAPVPFRVTFGPLAWAAAGSGHVGLVWRGPELGLCSPPPRVPLFASRVNSCHLDVRIPGQTCSQSQPTFPHADLRLWVIPGESG